MSPIIGTTRIQTSALALSIAALLSVFTATRVHGQTPRDPANDEAVYAKVIENVADSAIHRLDFFPARSQTRAQLLFFAGNDSVSVLFADIGRRSLVAAQAVDDMISRFGGTRVPDDLHGLHRDLMSALSSARSALDRLASASAGCQMGVSSTQRCQSPFTAASRALSDAYKRYLDTRVKIREQIRDTQTELPEFRRP